MDTKLINITPDGHCKCCFCSVSRVLWEFPLVPFTCDSWSLIVAKEVKTDFILELLQ